VSLSLCSHLAKSRDLVEEGVDTSWSPVDIGKLGAVKVEMLDPVEGEFLALGRVSGSQRHRLGTHLPAIWPLVPGIHPRLGIPEQPVLVLLRNVAVEMLRNCELAVKLIE
jgi:hypothetical protein